MKDVNYSFDKVTIIITKKILKGLLKQIERKSLLVINKHSVLFKEVSSMLKKLHLLSLLMNLTF